MTLSRNSILRWSTLTAGSVVTAAGLIAACSSSSTTSADAGSTSSSSTSTSSTKTSSTKSSSSNSSSSSSSSNSVSSSSTGPESTLYQRLGGHAGIRAAVNAIVAKELANADLASYFFFQAGAPANGHPTPDQIEACFTDFVVAALGGPNANDAGMQAYPTTVTDDAGSFTCRSMTTAHRALKIDTAVFTEFLTIAAGVLMPTPDSGISGADLATLAGALEGEATDIVTVPGDGGLVPFPDADLATTAKLDATY